MILTRERVTIRGPFGPRIVEGFRHGDWAVFRMPDCKDIWALTLLPIGFILPLEWAAFKRLRSACNAMVEIQRLKNGWERVVQADMTLPLRDRMIAICRANGAVEGPVTIAWKIDEPAFGQTQIKRVNGYRRP